MKNTKFYTVNIQSRVYKNSKSLKKLYIKTDNQNYITAKLKTYLILHSGLSRCSSHIDKSQKFLKTNLFIWYTQTGIVIYPQIRTYLY